MNISSWAPEQNAQYRNSNRTVKLPRRFMPFSLTKNKPSTKQESMRALFTPHLIQKAQTKMRTGSKARKARKTRTMRKTRKIQNRRK